MCASNKKIKIAFFLPTLGAGGAERVMSFLAQKLDPESFETTLVVIGYEKDKKYDVKGVKLVFLNQSRVLFSIPVLFNFLRKTNVDIAFSAIKHLNVVMGLLSIFFARTKFVGREVSVISVLKDYPEETNRSYPSFISKWGYRLLDAVVCQSDDMLQDMIKSQPKLVNKAVTINNPVTDKFQPKKQKADTNGVVNFVTVASLEPRKGHIRILQALAKFDDTFTYTLIGDGAQKETIFAEAKKLGLHDKIVHLPFTDKVHDYLANSALFLQGSYVEGFPNALLESCAVGTPVVAFNAPGGINEIIEQHVNGFIVEDENEFLHAIETILASENFDPKTVSTSVLNKYSSANILKKYEDLFFKLANT